MSVLDKRDRAVCEPNVLWRRETREPSRRPRREAAETQCALSHGGAAGARNGSRREAPRLGSPPAAPAVCPFCQH